MKINSFKVKILDGNIQFKSDFHKELFHKWLAQYNDKEVSLLIDTDKSKRSDDQHRYLFGVYYRLISEETGHTTEELHSLFKGMFLSEVREVLGNKVRVQTSSTTLSKSQFSEFIQDIAHYTGIVPPNTEAHLGYSYHK